MKQTLNLGQNNYLKELRSQLIDKAFFVEKLPPNITTIIDYGCSDGTLLNFIKTTDVLKGKNEDSVYPAYYLIGIESDDAFRNSAKSHNVKAYKNLEEFFQKTKRYYDMEKTCVNFSSSLHEMFYEDKYETIGLLRRLQDEYKVGAISIRDMFLEFPWDTSTDRNFINYTETVGLMRTLMECYPLHFGLFIQKHIPSTIMSDKDKLFMQLIHFMLKCIYIRSDEYPEDQFKILLKWEKECFENYLAFQEYFREYNNLDYNKYNVIWNLNYSLPYLHRVWKDKFYNRGIDGIIDKICCFVKTHKQMLLVRKPYT